MIEYANSLTVHLLNSEPVVIRQLVIRAQSLVPGIHERSRNRAVCQAKRVAKFMRGYREKAGPWKAKEKHFSRQTWLSLSLSLIIRVFFEISLSLSLLFLREKQRRNLSSCNARITNVSFHPVEAGGKTSIRGRRAGSDRQVSSLSTSVAIHTYILRNLDVNSSWLRYTGSQVLLIKSLLEDEHENKWNGLRSSSEGTRDCRDSRYIFTDILFTI